MHSTSVLVIAYPRNSSRTNAVQCSEVQTVVVRSHRNEFDARNMQLAVRRRRRRGYRYILFSRWVWPRYEYAGSGHVGSARSSRTRSS